MLLLREANDVNLSKLPDGVVRTKDCFCLVTCAEMGNDNVVDEVDNLQLHQSLDHLEPGGIDIHRHWGAYATLVRRGEYTEAGIEGRLNIGANTLVIHPKYHLHSDLVNGPGVVTNIDLGDADVGHWRAVKGPAVERLTRRDTLPCVNELLASIADAETMEFAVRPTWIKDIAKLDVSDFTQAQSEISREHAHRTFKHYFGMPPGRYRRERKLQHAISLFSHNASLADIAFEAGFADQSHMTRLLNKEFGLTPRQFRTKITPVQE